jgi:hypothetical protein
MEPWLEVRLRAAADTVCCSSLSPAEALLRKMLKRGLRANPICRQRNPVASATVFRRPAGFMIYTAALPASAWYRSLLSTTRS